MKQFEQVVYKKSFPEFKLEQALSTVIHIPEKKTNPMLSPSGLSCRRAAAFKLAGSTVKADEETYESGLAAAMGSFCHQRIQKFLSASDIWVDVETFISEHPDLGLSIAQNQKSEGELSLVFSGIRQGKKVSPPFSFQCDGILFIEGQYYIMEIKSETEAAWQKREAPNPKHADQGTGYSFLYGIPNILWVYVSRESFGTHRKIYLQEIPQTSISAFSSMCLDIGNAVEEGDIGRLPKAKDCRYCGFIDICKKLDK